MTLEARVAGEVDQKIGHLRDIIALHDRKNHLEAKLDSLQDQMEERQSAAAHSDVATDEDIISLFERLAQSEVR